MAATRLRRTFNYPTESDDEDAVEQGMDEQDQAHLLTTLSTHDTTSTRLYTLLLLIFPLTPALLYIPRLFRLTTILPSLVAIASLCASACTLYFLPLPPVKVGIIHTSTSDLKSEGGGGEGKKKGKYTGGYGYNPPTSTSTSTSTSRVSTAKRRPYQYMSDEWTAMAALYIVPANAAICVIFAIIELWQGRAWSEGMMVGGGYLPGLVLVTLLWARRELRTVDLGELEKMKIRADIADFAARGE